MTSQWCPCLMEPCHWMLMTSCSIVQFTQLLTTILFWWILTTFVLDQTTTFWNSPLPNASTRLYHETRQGYMFVIHSNALNNIHMSFTYFVIKRYSQLWWLGRLLGTREDWLLLRGPWDLRHLKWDMYCYQSKVQHDLSTEYCIDMQWCMVIPASP